jgi:hypothetical protein
MFHTHTPPHTHTHTSTHTNTHTQSYMYTCMYICIYVYRRILCENHSLLFAEILDVPIPCELLHSLLCFCRPASFAIFVSHWCTCVLTPIHNSLLHTCVRAWRLVQTNPWSTSTMASLAQTHEDGSYSEPAAETY